MPRRMTHRLDLMLTDREWIVGYSSIKFMEGCAVIQDLTPS